MASGRSTEGRREVTSRSGDTAPPSGTGPRAAGWPPTSELSLPQLLLAACAALRLGTSVLSLLLGEALKAGASVVITLSDKPSGIK